MSNSGKLLVNSIAPQTVAAALTSMPRGMNDVFAVFVASKEVNDWQPLVDALIQTGRTFFGGVFPELVDGGCRIQQGALLLRMRLQGTPLVVRDLKAPHELSQLGEQSLPGEEVRPTAIVLVDGLSGGNTQFMEATYHQLGGDVRYWGGGAGVLGQPGRPCLFSNEGFHAGGAIVCISPWQAKLGVRHGWQVMAGPLVATHTMGHTALEFNWRVAAKVYAEEIKRAVGPLEESTELSVLAASFPLGLKKEGEDLVVRDALSVGDDGSISFAGDIPENTVLSILEGKPESLLAAARQAAEDAVPASDVEVRHCLVADCVSRATFLGKEFCDELEAIKQGLSPLGSKESPCGVLTIGEISSRGDGYLEFFNKTCVVAVLHE